jgi:hypothetical protein
MLRGLQQKLKDLPTILGGKTGKQIKNWVDGLDNDLADKSRNTAANIVGTPTASGIGSADQFAYDWAGGTNAYGLTAAQVQANLDAMDWSWLDPNMFGGFSAFANGGIVKSAQLGLVGEAGPEAIIPLSKLGNMGGETSYNITVNAGMGANGAQVGAQIVEAIKKYEKSNGKRWRTS